MNITRAGPKFREFETSRGHRGKLYKLGAEHEKPGWYVLMSPLPATALHGLARPFQLHTRAAELESYAVSMKEVAEYIEVQLEGRE